MTDELFEMPDMDEIQRSLNDALGEAQEAMENIPQQMNDLDNALGSLSNLMNDMPSQLAALGQAVGGFSESHQDNLETLVGEPDWKLKADIRVGNILHLEILGQLDIGKIKQTWGSTQGGGFDSLVSGVIGNAADDLDGDTMDQVMDQLKMGRGMARIERIDILSCSIQGAPGNAIDDLRLSPEGNIPLSLNDGYLNLEFAPALTIRNSWENASLPTFSPMAEEIQVPLSKFDKAAGFSDHFEPSNQEYQLMLDIHFEPLG